MNRLLNSLFKYVVAAVLIFVPLYPKFPLFSIPYTYVQIRSEDFLIAAVWGIFLLKTFLNRKLKLPPLTFQIAVYLLVGLLSLISSLLITQNIFPSIAILHYLRRVEYLSLFFLVYWSAKDAPDIRKYYLEITIAASLFVLGYGLAQIYLRAPVISTMDAEASKGMALTLRPGVPLSSTFAGHYDLAVYLIMIVSFLTAVICSLKNWLKQLPLYLLFLALLWLFMQAGSRIGLLGLFLSITLICYLYRRYLLGLFLLLSASALVVTAPQFIGRFQSIFKVITANLVIVQPVIAATTAAEIKPTEALRAIQQDTSTSIRFDVEWPRSLRSFYKNPLLGTGFSSLGLATDNDYLRALGETGLIGLVAFLSVILGLWRALQKNLHGQTGTDKLLTVSAMGILLSFTVTAIFLDVFESSKIAILFWSFMGLSLSTRS